MSAPPPPITDTCEAQGSDPLPDTPAVYVVDGGGAVVGGGQASRYSPGAVGGGGVQRDQVSNLLTFPFALFTLYRTASIQTKDGIGVYMICMRTLNRGYFGPGGVTLTQSKINYIL